MGALQNYSEEKREKIAEAIKNNNVDEYKNLINYNSMTFSEQLGAMVWYQDMADTFRKTSNTNSERYIESSNDGDIRKVLENVTNIAKKAIY